MGLSFDISNSDLLFKRNWDRWFLPLIPLVLAVLSAYFIPFLLLHILLSSVFLLITVFWWRFYRLPKNNLKNIGIIIAIKTENRKQAAELYSKFYNTYKNLFIEINQPTKHKILFLFPHHFQHLFNLDKFKASTNYRKQVFNKTNSQIAFFGNCIVGNSNDIANYEFDLNGAVFHKEIEGQHKQFFSKEFSNVLFNNELKNTYNSKLRVPLGDSLDSFQILSEHLEMVTKYILAKAFLYSGDYKPAHDIFKSIINEIDMTKRSLNVYKSIYPAACANFHELNNFLAYMHNMEFQKTWDLSSLELMNNHLEIAQKYTYYVQNKKRDSRYFYAVMKAIYVFVKGTADEAIKILLDNCQKVNDAAWKYSLAFLYAYNEKLLTSYKWYIKAFESPNDSSNILDVEIFITNVLKEEPTKFSLYFALGLINLKLKKDYNLAEDYFMQFKANYNVKGQLKKIVDGCIKHLNDNLTI